MIEIEERVRIDRAPEAVWAVMRDVERWPDWTATMESVDLLDGAAGLGPGVRARLGVFLTMFGRRTVMRGIWRVTAYDEGRGFTWENTRFGLRSFAGHYIDPDGAGSLVTLTITMSGLPATMLRPLILGPSRENVTIEAAGLKQRVEAGAGP